jgi:hypothetical protein
VAYAVFWKQAFPDDSFSGAWRMSILTAPETTCQLVPYLRHIREVTGLHHASPEAPDNRDHRYNRTIPILICPWKESEAVVHECDVALTRDIADRGVGVVANRPLAGGDVVLGFCVPFEGEVASWFFRGSPRHFLALEGGLWLSGIELQEFMNDNWRPQLAGLFPLAEKLLPPSFRARLVAAGIS